MKTTMQVFVCALLISAAPVWAQVTETEQTPAAVTASQSQTAVTTDTGGDTSETNQAAAKSAFESAMEALAVGGYSNKKKAIDKLLELGDERALPVMVEMADRQTQHIKVDKKGKRLIFVLSDSEGVDAVSGAKLSLQGLSLSKPRVNNSVVSRLKRAVAQIQLGSSKPRVRRAGAKKLVEKADDSFYDILSDSLGKETDGQTQAYLRLALAKLDLGGSDDAKRLAAIKTIESTAAIGLMAEIKKLLEKDKDGNFLVQAGDPVRQAAEAAMINLESRSFWYSRVRDLIFGLSLGSILLLMALGLAISFGLMGVINMAHGEMLMLGAYTAYTVQEFFRSAMPGAFEFYLLAALPVAFVVTAAIGMALERGVIRHLYGRPLDTLLVTWGISLIIIQLVRLSYGAANVTVENPTWLKGGAELLPGQIFPYARLMAIGFAIAIVSLVWYLLSRTSLGLKVRAVQQNRGMAACMGINTTAVDMWTFGLGAGIAGMGGVVLSQILLVGPNLGQSLIIDSFMVVVTGGVGNIAGTIAGAYGLGVLDKFLEPVVGLAMVKVCILVLIILFIQWRPEGMFPPKGRAGET